MGMSGRVIGVGAAGLLAGLAMAAVAYVERTASPSPAKAEGGGDAATALLATSGSAAPTGKPAKPQPLVTLDIEAPRYNPDLPPPLMFSSGWPLVFKATARVDALGIATDAQPSEFPTMEETGYVVFDDPDGCLALPEPFEINYDNPSLPNPDNPCPVLGSPRPQSDETYLEFANDVDSVGVPDNAGNPGRSAALGDAVSGAPVFTGAIEEAGVLTIGPVAVGPATGLATASGIDDSIDDGVGYGADDDLPGLVLLSATGVGLVLDTDFNPPFVRQQRNLAGFLNWAAYELRGANGNTVVHAGMVLPYGLVAPLMQTDDCIGTPTDAGDTFFCDEPSQYRIDGGALVTAPVFGSLQDNYPANFNARAYELRAFVVSGVAPSLLTDMNGDGVVTAADATAAGYRVISNEKVVRLRQYHGNYCGGISLTQQTFFADIDGNGRVLGGIVCPAGPGQITRVPD